MTAPVAFDLTWHIGRTGKAPTTGTRRTDTEKQARAFLRDVLDRICTTRASNQAPADWDVTATLTAHPAAALPHLVRRWDGCLPDVRDELDGDDLRAREEYVELGWSIYRDGKFVLTGMHRSHSRAEARAFLTGALTVAGPAEEDAAVMQASASLMTWTPGAPRPSVVWSLDPTPIRDALTAADQHIR